MPNPLRCFKCQGYGHGSSKCTHAERCSKCGGNHSSDACTENNPSCVHCSGQHSASDRKCPKFLEEKAIVTLKYKENISFYEARKRVTARTTTLTNTSYADAARKKAGVTSVETQTDFTWPQGEKLPRAISSPASVSTSCQTSEADNTPPSSSKTKGKSKNKQKGASAEKAGSQTASHTVDCADNQRSASAEKAGSQTASHKADGTKERSKGYPLRRLDRRGLAEGTGEEMETSQSPPSNSQPTPGTAPRPRSLSRSRIQTLSNTTK